MVGKDESIRGLDLDRALADAVTEVVELGATNFAPGDDFDLGNAGAVHRVDALNSGSVGNLANGEGLVDSAASFGENDALEDLDPLLAALDDSVVDFDGITDVEVGDL